jgi:hypothetical protein
MAVPSTPMCHTSSTTMRTWVPRLVVTALLRATPCRPENAHRQSLEFRHDLSRIQHFHLVRHSGCLVP